MTANDVAMTREGPQDSSDEPIPARRLSQRLGEVAMIVIGVLIALFLGDRDERCKASEAFEQTLA